MFKKISILSCIVAGLIWSCESSDDINSNPASDTFITISTNSAELNQRISRDEAGVLSLSNTNVWSKTNSTASDFPLVQIAEIEAPKDEKGRQLQATHVFVKDNYAYVAYTMRGEEYSGAVDVIEISNPYSPKVIVSARMLDMDITALTVANGKLWIAAAANRDKFPELTSSAMIISMPLQNGMLTEEYTIIPLDGQVTTDVVAYGDSFFATSGDKGKVYKGKMSDYSALTGVALEDLRAVLYANGEIITLSGEHGIQVFDSNQLQLKRSFATAPDVKEAKRTMDTHEQKVLVAEGFNGVGVYDLTSGQKVQTLPIKSLSNEAVDPMEVVSNAVSVNESKMFVANGAAGLAVYQAAQQMDWLGNIGIEGSSNYVKSVGDFIYVASGKGGLKIIKMENNNSQPNCDGYPTYTGSANLTLNSNEQKQFAGNTALSGVMVNSNAILLHCGALTVQNDMTLNSKGTVEIKGSLTQGRQGQNTRLTINSNAELIVSGKVVIYGDLTLNSNAKLTFEGTGSSITIFGKVSKGSNVHITGNFTDTENKL